MQASQWEHTHLLKGNPVAMLKPIHKSIDEFGTIEVLDDGAKRYLTFGNEHEQSCQIKAQPHIPQHEYSRAIMLALLFNEPERIAVLGLGGGTLAFSFLHACPGAQLIAVELRQEVIRIAQRFFSLPKHEPRLQILNQDAFYFVRDNTTVFDLLVADLYHHDGIDETQMQRQFIRDCETHISPNGWLVLNYWLDHDLQTEILHQLHESFACVYMCNSGGGNLIIYAGKSFPHEDFLLPTRVKPLAKTLGFSLNYYLKRLTFMSAE